MSLNATSKKQVAVTIGVCDKTISNWLMEGCPGEPKHYVLADVIQWAVKNKWSPPDSDAELLDSIEDKDLKDQLVMERIEKIRRENKLADFQIEKTRSSLVDTTIIKRFLLKLCEQMKQPIEEIEAKLGKGACGPFQAAIDRIKTKIEAGALDFSEFN